VPVVTNPPSGWSSTPESTVTASGSRRWVVKREVPGRRRSRAACTSSTVKRRLGGHPSTTQPIAGPWLSPKVVTRNRCPKVLNDMTTRLSLPAP